MCSVMLRACLARELSAIRTFPGPTLARKRGKIIGVSVALLTGAAVLLGGALFVALRAPGRAESEANANKALPATAAS